MSYTALYRKFRPLNFRDMVGQEHITKTLKNQIMSDRVGHAYLFTGGRGTGKTTTAKILARAVNCLKPIDGEPCNECEICKEILNGSLTDVVEMDAASNNSVEDIRAIREEVNFLPTKAKYRVYIIDEVHMLSTGAFNALLKTLEEPPEHVKFLLATTEPQKLPATILSRCQRFDYKKISDEDIIKRLKIICSKDKINITDGALKIIATLSEGAMRDAISILERCAQENIEKIDETEVKDLVGIPSLEYINKITLAIFNKDETEALNVLEEVINQGKDLYNFLWEIIKYIKDILIFKTTKNLSIYSESELAIIEELSNKTDKEEILELIYELSDLENDIKFSSHKTIMFQTGIIKACRKCNGTIRENNLNIENNLEKRIAKLEEILATKTEKKEKNFIDKFREEYKKEEEFAQEEKKTQIKKESKKNLEASQMWKNVLETLKKTGKFRLYTCLANTVVSKNGDMILEINFPNGMTSFNKQILDDANNRNDLIKVIMDITGEEMHIKYGENNKLETEKNTNKNPIEELGIDINIID
ncbi:MAG: DNA polymerase III subunit gamma/tau [Candidatus Scatovivens sp.]